MYVSRLRARVKPWSRTTLSTGEGVLMRQVYLASNPSKAITAASTSALSALPSPFTLDSSIPATVLKAVREGKVHRSIKDLDDHLEDS
jgi:chorismate-pyruvate lyase